MRNGIIIAPGESKQTLKNNSDEELFFIKAIILY